MLAAGAAAIVAVARVAALAGHPLAASWWSPIAYLWQDALVVLAFAALDAALRNTRRVAWAAYVVFVSYVALSVPVTRVMSTPMTWTMWRAAGGALSDSVWMYVTVANVLWIATAIGASVLPLYVGSGFSRTDIGVGPPKGGPYVLMITIAALGPTARARVDTRGLDRNAWSALAATAFPRVVAASGANTPHLSAARTGRVDARATTPLDLTSLRGAAAGRNVILVSLESTAAQYLSLYGASGEDAMPHLSALARSAIVFEYAYAVYPESIKGLFSILCSRYPPFDRAADRLADVPCRSLASHLSARGYRTALFHSGRFGYLGMDAVVRHRGFTLLADAGDIGGERESSFGVDDRTTVDLVLGWIDRIPRHDRFFVTYLPIAGHHPYDSPEAAFPAADEFGRYRNALRYADAALGDLIDGLRARQLDTNTFVIVLGDHGEAFGQHDGNFGHTFQLYEENVRVPFLIAAPGVIPEQRRAPQVVSLLDTAPTVLDLLGLPADPDYQGATMLARESKMAFFFADYSLGLLGLRDGNMKYIYELDSRRARMFDLDRDPAEAHDIADENAHAVRWYADRLRTALAY